MRGFRLPVPPHAPHLERALLEARAAIERAEQLATGPTANLNVPPLLRAARQNINAALGRPGYETTPRRTR